MKVHCLHYQYEDLGKFGSIRFVDTSVFKHYRVVPKGSVPESLCGEG